VPAFIFIRETSHNAYRASTYVVEGFFTYLPFRLLQNATYPAIVWFELKLHRQFLYVLVMLSITCPSTNSAVFISSMKKLTHEKIESDEKLYPHP
jgi:hypothetical protein